MVTTATPWLVVIGATVLASLAMWVLGPMGMARRLDLIRKRFLCPVRGREVEVDFLVRAGELERLRGVERCSAFQLADAITCDKACLHLPAAQEASVLLHSPLALAR